MKVLDHGEVVLLDYMGGDAKVVGSARISTGKDPSKTSKGEESDRKLIGYLMSNGHGTPFEHAVFQFYVKAPIFVVREWQRHRMASYNEFSMRYAEIGTDENPATEFYVPDHIRLLDPKNKQSSIRVDELKDDLLTAIEDLRASSQASFETYRYFIDQGMAREMARMVLPVNVYTRFWFTVNARSLMNFLMLRNSAAAQWEIQQYAAALEDIFQRFMPWTHHAFEANGRKAP